MDVPMSWLKEYAAVTAPLKDFMEDMTMSGSKEKVLLLWQEN